MFLMRYDASSPQAMVMCMCSVRAGRSVVTIV